MLDARDEVQSAPLVSKARQRRGDERAIEVPERLVLEQLGQRLRSARVAERHHRRQRLLPPVLLAQGPEQLGERCRIVLV